MSLHDALVTSFGDQDAWNGPTSRDSDTRIARGGSNVLPIPLPLDVESARWHAYLLSLAQQEAEGAISAAQRRAFLSMWQRALDRQPTLRRPTVGSSSAGHIQMTWSYVDIPDLAFTIEVHRDGRLDWFYRDRKKQEFFGTDDDPIEVLPENALALLAEGFPARR